MTATLILYKHDGTPQKHTLSVHHNSGGTPQLKLVMNTSTEHFDSWLFFFLRDHGAFIETTDPKTIAAALNLPVDEPGIVPVAK